MKKIVSTALTLILTLTLALNVFAADFAKMVTTQQTGAFEKASEKSEKLATLKDGYKFTPIGSTKSYWKIEFKKSGKTYVGYVPKKHANKQELSSGNKTNTDTKQTSADTKTTAKPKEPTMGQKNALQKAKQYLSIMAFSHKGLVEQLEHEKFSHDEAVYGADNCGANWNEQAAKKAKQYLEIMSFSREGLIEQLEHEGFTRKQAEYGVKAVGY